MEGASVVSYSPRTLEQVFKDFKNRRAGMLRALTVDVEDFCRECDPEKENLCLYGFPDGSWKVSLPADEVPPELPEPALGINFARDGMVRKDWLSLVAVHSDAWLIAVAFYYGARFDKNDRRNLFDMMNALPTIYDVVTGRKTVQDKTNGSNGGNKSKPSSKVKSSFTQKQPSRPAPSYEEEDETPDEEDDEDHEDTFCGSCGLPYNSSEFWIGCDICEKWFHGKCVKITPARAEHIKQYKCPSCTNKRARV